MATRDIKESEFVELTQKGTVLLDWWAPWCGPCRAFAPTYEAAALKHPDVVFGKVNTDEQPGLASAFQIRSIPTLMAFRDGVLVFAQAGMLPPAALEDLVTQVQALDMDEVRKKVEAARADTGR